MVSGFAESLLKIGGRAAYENDEILDLHRRFENLNEGNSLVKCWDTCELYKPLGIAKKPIRTSAFQCARRMLL